MPSSVRITTTSQSTSSTLAMNIGYLKTVPGILKICQLVVGAVCTGVVGFYYNYPTCSTDAEVLFFLTTSIAFLTTTFCLFVSCLFSLGTAGLIAKSLFDIVYHSVAALHYLAASLALIIIINDAYYVGGLYDPFMAASVFGFINMLLYTANTIFAQRAYSGF